MCLMASAKSEERFNIKAFMNPSGKKVYRVTGYMPDGSRVRKNFILKADAIECKGELESQLETGGHAYSLERTTLSRSQVQDAENAMTLSGGKTLTSILTEYCRLEELAQQKGGINLPQAVTFFEKHYRPEIEELSVESATNRFLKSKSNLEASTVRSYRTACKLLVGNKPNRCMHEFNVYDIDRILKVHKNPGSQRAYRRGISVFFNWAVRFHHCLENPCERLDKAPVVMTKIGILSLEECKRLLKASVLLHDGLMVSSIAIALFSGLRPSEIDELQPEDIRKDSIRVTGGKLRRTLNRSVPMPSMLKKWMKLYPFVGRPSGADYKMKKLKAATKAANWVDDVLRHTSISFQLERDRNEGLTAFNNGTSQQMINQHYRDVVDDAQEVADFWTLAVTDLDSVELSSDLNQRDFYKWPADAELKKLVWATPLSRLGKDLGLSDNAIRRRCQKRGIELPKNGFWQKQRTVKALL